MEFIRRNIAVVLASLVAIAVLGVVLRKGRGHAGRVVLSTLGEVCAVHADVLIGPREVRGTARFSAGDHIATGGDGRGRIQLDDGTMIVLDRATRVAVSRDGVELESGRIFVRGGALARTQVTAGGASTHVSSSAVAFERTSSGAAIYCASGEIVVRAGGSQERVQSGETATVSAGGLKVAPEKAYNDWTYGMATPSGLSGSPRGAIGELWGRLSDTADDAGSPLAIRSHEVTARIDGEVAITRVETTYFNGGSTALRGDFRMAIPPGGIVSRFALRRGDVVEEGIVRAGKEETGEDVPRLEWAGSGWVRGDLQMISAGATVGVVVEYVEWLSPSGGTLRYRYPMRSEGTIPLVGEFRARIDVSRARARAISVGPDAVVEGDVVEVRKADFRPESDLVVELDVPMGAAAGARAYVAAAQATDLSQDPYVLVRTEIADDPAARGMTLVIVLDSSWSIAAPLLDAERSVVESIVEGLGDRDRVVVFAADQLVRTIGPPLGPVDEARRKSIREALSNLRPGGSTDLGAALERAADALPPDATTGMVIYVGDGWPTMGDEKFEAIRSRLARRAGGIPRLAAVAVGPTANRMGLTALIHGSGPVLEIADHTDAAETAVSLLAEALKPSVSGVELDLGSTIDRVYPRGARTVLAGSTVTVVGRLRGPLPSSVALRFNRGGTTVTRTLPLERTRVVSKSDIIRRWAATRVEELALRGEGLEATIDIALRARLLTPWTGWHVVPPGSGAEVRTSPLSARVLELSFTREGPFSARIATPPLTRGALLEPAPIPTEDEADAYRRAMTASARRTLDEAMPQVRKCRDARAALRPEITGTLRVNVAIDGSGRVRAVRVRAASAADDDYLLDRCVELVIANLPFFDTGTATTVKLDHELRLPPARDAQKRMCSSTSKLPLTLRRTVWRERMKTVSASPAYVRAKQSCELLQWSDHRTFLELVLERWTDVDSRIAIAKELDVAGESDAADVLKRATVARATTLAELVAARNALIGAEPVPGKEFEKQYGAARSDVDRLAVLRRFMRLSPHSSRLKQKLFAILEVLGRKSELATEIDEVRRDPFADAAILADGASALRRIGLLEEGRRAFGELAERAPRDPFARAYAGDRLREEGLFDDATVEYEALETLLPGDPGSALRLALAHAGAGRLDVASRILARVAETGGSAADAKLGDLATITAAVLLAEAGARGVSADDAARLARRQLELPLPDATGMVLIRTPTLTTPLEARIAKADSKKDADPPDINAAPLGLFAMRLERGDGDVRIRLRRPKELGPERSIKARVGVLVFGEDRSNPKLVEREIELGADGKDTELRWQGGALL